MGIRFCCPNGHKLHVKAFLAGKRGICPECGAKVEIPEESVIVMATGCQKSQAGIKKAEQTSRIKEAGDEVSWFVRTSTGDQYGPATNRTLQNWISQGRVSSDCLIWRGHCVNQTECQRVLRHVAAGFGIPDGFLILREGLINRLVVLIFTDIAPGVSDVGQGSLVDGGDI